MEIFIYKLNEKVFEGMADSITMPGIDGEITILKNHIPLISRLKKGQIKLKSDNHQESFEIEGGTIQISNNKLIGLVK